MPCVDGPFLEIFEYKNCNDHSTPPVNQPGYGHISFEVEDIQATFNAVIKAGGTPLGEITDFGTAKVPFLYVYVRDPRGKRCRTGAALWIVSRHEDCFWSWLYENVRSETAHRKFIPHIGN